MAYLTFEQLASVFHLPLSSAAEYFGLGSTALKRACRRNNIPRWPNRRLQSLDKLKGELEKRLQTCTTTEDATRIAKEIEHVKAQKELVMRKPHVLAPDTSSSSSRNAEEAHLHHQLHHSPYAAPGHSADQQHLIPSQFYAPQPGSHVPVLTLQYQQGIPSATHAHTHMVDPHAHAHHLQMQQQQLQQSSQIHSHQLHQHQHHQQLSAPTGAVVSGSVSGGGAVKRVRTAARVTPYPERPHDTPQYYIPRATDSVHGAVKSEDANGEPPSPTTAVIARRSMSWMDAMKQYQSKQQTVVEARQPVHLYPIPPAEHKHVQPAEQPVKQAQAETVAPSAQLQQQQFAPSYSFSSLFVAACSREAKGDTQPRPLTTSEPSVTGSPNSHMDRMAIAAILSEKEKQ